MSNIWDTEEKDNMTTSDSRSLENSSLFIAKYFCTEYNWKNINREGMDSKANIRAELYKHQFVTFVALVVFLYIKVFPAFSRLLHWAEIETNKMYFFENVFL